MRKYAVIVSVAITFFRIEFSPVVAKQFDTLSAKKRYSLLRTVLKVSRRSTALKLRWRALLTFEKKTMPFIQVTGIAACRLAKFSGSI